MVHDPASLAMGIIVVVVVLHSIGDCILVGSLPGERMKQQRPGQTGTNSTWSMVCAGLA